MSRLDGQARGEQDQEHDVEQRQQVVSGFVVAQPAAGREPLHADGQLHQDAEEEEEGLICGRQVDARVEWDQEDELHEQRGVDEGVGEAGAEPDYGTG